MNPTESTLLEVLLPIKERSSYPDPTWQVGRGQEYDWLISQKIPFSIRHEANEQIRNELIYINSYSDFDVKVPDKFYDFSNGNRNVIIFESKEHRDKFMVLWI